MRASDAALAALAAAALTALCAAGCSAGGASGAAAAAAVLPAFPYPLDGPRVFLARESGLSEIDADALARLAAAIAAREVRPGPAHLAPDASALTADASRIAAIVNGRGFAVLEASEDGSAYRATFRTQPGLAGLTAGGIWPRDGAFIALAYRYPFAETAPAAPPEARARFVYVVDGEAASESPPPGDGLLGEALAQGWELLGLFPSDGVWLARLRSESGSRVLSRRLALRDPLLPDPADGVLSAAAFESRLQPRRIGPGADGELAGPAEALDAAALLRRALADHPAPALVRLRDARGGDAWYSWAGAAAAGGDRAPEAVELSAFLSAQGELAILSRDGEIRVADRNSVRSLRAAAPLPGAAFTAIAAAGGLAACAWETGGVAERTAAGLAALPLAPGAVPP